MAGDYIEPIELSQGTGYIHRAIELAIEHQFAPQEAIDRLSRLAAAIDYVHQEGAVWRELISNFERLRSNGSWGPENCAWMIEQANAALAVSAPAILPEIEKAAVQTLLGLLVDKYGGDLVAVSLDSALEARRP